MCRVRMGGVSRNLNLAAACAAGIPGDRTLPNGHQSELVGEGSDVAGNCARSDLAMTRDDDAMTQPSDRPSNWWVVSFLVTGDKEGVMAVSAEGLIRSSLWENKNGSQPLTSTVRRFGDLTPAEQDE